MSSFFFSHTPEFTLQTSNYAAPPPSTPPQLRFYWKHLHLAAFCQHAGISSANGVSRHVTHERAWRGQRARRRPGRVGERRERVAPTCQVEGKGDEAVVASQELQRLLPLHQRPKVIGHRLPVEEVVDANQEVPGGKERIRRVFATAACSLQPFTK